MRTKSLILIAIIAATAGMLLYAFHRGWIMICSPYAKLSYELEEQLPTGTKKKATLYYWQNNKWHNEKTELLWLDNKAENIHYLISSWLKLLDEEQVTHKRIALQSVMLSPADQAFISFDRIPWTKDATTFDSSNT